MRVFREESMRVLSFLILALFTALSAGEVRVRILQTSDLHGNLKGDDTSAAGILRLASEIDRRRREFPPGGVLVIDTGDTFQGSLVSLISSGKAPMAVLKAMGTDVWVPGNHDMDYGFPTFLEVAEFMRPQILCGNLAPKSSAYANYPAWRLFDCNGARIAVIGATASYLPHWFLEFDKAFSLESARAMLRRVLPEVLAAKPDGVIFATHQGWVEADPRGVNEIADIAQEFPEIDLILGAHTHRVFPGRSIGPHTWYVQPGAHGEFFSQADLLVDTEKHTVVEIASKLIRVPEDGPEEATATSAIQEWLQKATAVGQEPLTPPLPADIPANGRPGAHCAVSELICQAIAESSGCELALHGTLSDVGFKAGEVVTMEKLFQVIPYENTIVTCKVTAEELSRIVAEQWTLRKVYSFCGLWGATAKVSEEQTEIISIGVKEEPVDGVRRYTLALNSFTAAGSGRTPVLEEILRNPACETTNTGISTREALKAWFQKHPGEKVVPRVWLR